MRVSRQNTFAWNTIHSLILSLIYRLVHSETGHQRQILTHLRFPGVFVHHLQAYGIHPVIEYC